MYVLTPPLPATKGKPLNLPSCLSQMYIPFLSIHTHPFLCLEYSHKTCSLQPYGLQHTRPPCPSTNSWSLLKLMPIKSVMPFNHLILCHPLLLPPSIFPSIRIFFNESVLCIRWPQYWNFSFSISPSHEQPGLISFRMD